MHMLKIYFVLLLVLLVSPAESMPEPPDTALYRLANYEYYRGNTERAITLALQAMDACRRRNDTAGALRAMILAGDILRGNELFDQSAAYLTEALKDAILLNDSGLIAEAYNRLAALGTDDARISQDTVVSHARKSLEIARRIRDDKLIYNNLNILGVLEISRKHYDRSIRHLQEALVLAQKTFREDEPLILHNLARNYFLLDNNTKAVELEKRAFELATSLNIPQYIRLSSSYLKDYYTSVGNYQEALKYAVKYYQAKDFILTQKVLVQLKEFNNRIETEKQRSVNQQLLMEQKLTRSRMQNMVFAGILLLLLLAVTTGFLIFQHRQRQKLKRIASKLDQSNKVLTRFISVLGHDLRSPFSAILGFTDILKNDSETGQQERAMITEKLYNVSRSTFRLLERILEWSRLHSGTVRPVMKPFDLMEVVRESINILEPVALLKKIRILFDYPGKMMITADENMIFAVIRNLLSNAIKFSHAGGNIEIYTTKDNRSILLSIRDHGVGISPENQKLLFQLDQNYKTEGTAGERGTGLGLILCMEYLAMHGAKLELTSDVGKGSTFSMRYTLPA